MSLWPDVPATLFATDPRFPFSNANVGWVLSRKDVYGYKEGYRRAAIQLAESIDTSRASPDLLVWPIAWLWRHHLELALKEIIALNDRS